MPVENDINYLALADALERFQHRAQSSLLGGESPFVREEDGRVRTPERKTLERYACGIDVSIRGLGISYLGKAMFMQPPAMVLEELRTVRVLSEAEHAALSELLIRLNLELLASEPSDGIIHLLHQRAEALGSAMHDLAEAPAAQLTGAIWRAAEAAGLDPKRYDNRRLIIGDMYVRAELLTGEVQANGIWNAFNDNRYRPEDYLVPNELLVFTVDPGFFGLDRHFNEHQVPFGWREESKVLEFSTQALERYPWVKGAALL